MPDSQTRHMSLEVDDCQFSDDEINNSLIEVKENNDDNDVDIGRADLYVAYTPED